MISWVWGRSICSPLPLKQGISSKLIQRCVLRCISYTVRFLSAKPVPRLWVLSVSFSTVLWWDYKPLQGDSSCAIEQNGNREGVLLILFQSRNLWSDWPCIESSFFILKNKIKKMEGKTPQKVTMSLGTPTVGKSFSGLRSGSAGSFLVSSLLLVSAVQAQLLHWCSSQPFLLEARLPLYLSLVLERCKKRSKALSIYLFPYFSLFLCRWGLQYKYIFIYQNAHTHTNTYNNSYIIKSIHLNIQLKESL